MKKTIKTGKQLPTYTKKNIQIVPINEEYIKNDRLLEMLYRSISKSNPDSDSFEPLLEWKPNFISWFKKESQDTALVLVKEDEILCKVICNGGENIFAPCTHKHIRIYFSTLLKNMYTFTSLKLLDEDFKKALSDCLKELKRENPLTIVEFYNAKLLDLIESIGFEKDEHQIAFKLDTHDIDRSYMEKHLKLDLNSLGYTYKIILKPNETEVSQLTKLEVLVDYEHLVRERGGGPKYKILTEEGYKKRYGKYWNSSNFVNPHILVYDRDELIGCSHIVLDVTKPKLKGIHLMTVVSRMYRKQGLAAWMKCYLLSYIEEKHPSINSITTENAHWNTGMKWINKCIGFKQEKDIRFSYLYLRNSAIKEGLDNWSKAYKESVAELCGS